MNVSSSSNSYAAFERPDSATLFKKTDANGDGKITQEELASALEQRSQKSANRQGTSAEDLFTQLDADGDGEITETEHEAGLAEMESKGEMRPAPPPSSEEAADLIDVLTPLLDELAARDAAANGSTDTADAADTQATLDALIEQLMTELKNRGDATNLYEAEA
jgi:hypothetical protein